MGLNLWVLEKLADLKVLQAQSSIMDIGSSNLYNASYAGIINLVKRYRPELSEEELGPWAKKIEAGAVFDPVLGGKNEAWGGELLEKCGMRYVSIDIAKGYKTEIFDLNKQTVPPEWRNAFDIVINCGTTEHIFNQANAFKVIHELTKPGGIMLHHLPVSGHTDHCYFIYTGRFFFDLAGTNEYQIMDAAYDGPAGNDDLLTSPKNFRQYFPVLNKCCAGSPLPVLNCLITIVLKKPHNRPFCFCVDTATSVGSIITRDFSRDLLWSMRHMVKRLRQRASGRFGRWLQK